MPVRFEIWGFFPCRAPWRWGLPPCGGGKELTQAICLIYNDLLAACMAGNKITNNYITNCCGESRSRVCPFCRKRSGQIITYTKGRCMVNASYLSAQETPAQKGAWFPQENVYSQRPQSIGSPQGKGPRKAHSLEARCSFCPGFRTSWFCGFRKPESRGEVG